MFFKSCFSFCHKFSIILLSLVFTWKFSVNVICFNTLMIELWLLEITAILFL